MSRKMTAVAAVALVTLAGCLDDGEFGGTGGWGGSSAAGERLAHQVCTEAVRDKGLRVVDIHKTNSVDHPFPRARPFKKGNNVSTVRKFGPLACAITFAVPALAQDGTPVDPSDIDAVTRMSNAVADAVVENVQSFEIWDDGDTTRLLLVARQKGLSMNCEGFEVDEERFRTTMTDVLGNLYALAGNPGQNSPPVDIALSSYSMAVGGEVAIAAHDRGACCAKGEELRTELAEDSESRVAVLVPAN